VRGCPDRREEKCWDNLHRWSGSLSQNWKITFKSRNWLEVGRENKQDQPARNAGKSVAVESATKAEAIAAVGVDKVSGVKRDS
jgi:hypothetical protein